MGARKVTEQKIRKALVSQLKEKNIMTDYSLSLVEDYIKYWKTEQELLKDVEERGVKVETYNSSGKPVMKTNESLADAQKNNAAMIKILQTLKLQEPVMRGSADDYL